MAEFKTQNLPASSISGNPNPTTTTTTTKTTTSSSTFTITCPPHTDIWDKPPSTHSHNAPLVYRSLRKRDFASARVLVGARWAERYDQGGLYLGIVTTTSHTTGTADAESQSPSTNNSPSSIWVKTGIEFFHGTPLVGTVATRQWSDWSLRPLPSTSPAATTATTASSTTASTSESESLAMVEIKIESNAHDGSLWVYVAESTGEVVEELQQHEDGPETEPKEKMKKRWSPIREVTWWATLDDKTEIWVGAYAARPAEVEEDLVVSFQGLKIETV